VLFNDQVLSYEESSRDVTTGWTGSTDYQLFHKTRGSCSALNKRRKYTVLIRQNYDCLLYS
jgi:hypothetical protein